MSKPCVIPDRWQQQDWDALCEQCGQALFMAAVAEKCLPASGPLEVTRCPGCTRALWYRSIASPVHVEWYRQKFVEPGVRRFQHRPERTAEGKHLDTRNFPHPEAA
ncbi:MAG: hypothetical protein NVSMB60_07960 [Mycobacterium sp.]